jgi:hypothetical protein
MDCWKGFYPEEEEELKTSLDKAKVPSATITQGLITVEVDGLELLSEKEKVIAIAKRIWEDKR